MAQPDYRGARGSNAGDAFHELWVLRQALALLNEDAGLTAITVEGLRAEDEAGTPQDQWDGVDCTFYYGGDNIDAADRIVVDQLKYSAASPEQPWTVARLIHSDNSKKDNSVIGRLAKAFAGLKKKRPELVAGRHLQLRLVSNQPLDPAVLIALSGQPSSQTTPARRGRPRKATGSDRDVLLKATGLAPSDVEEFVACLNFASCGSQSRLTLEERIHTTISAWTDDDARTAVNNLKHFVQRAMLPEGRNDYITGESVLAWLGFSNPGALFPCPLEIKQPDQPIPREVSQDVLKRMLDGEQRLCLHGEGGVGKTTILQEIKALLPDQSIMIVFDCYGGGRYLDADAFRHRPQDAFLQLSNDLARQLCIPLLLTQSPTHNYPKAFKKRLDRAAEVVTTNAPSALLVIAVDAADNSVTAAEAQGQRSFIHDFLSLGDLPPNVRFIVSARTGRLPMLDLPPTFAKIALQGFTPAETAQHVRSLWPEASSTWIDDFHLLSRGNPRVQRYALDTAQTEPHNALDYLRPNGRSLDQVFEQQFEQARLKTGQWKEILMFCSGLIALPRPIPLPDLAAVTGFTEAQLYDFASDLAPGVVLANRLVGFADEDFEQFVRNKAVDQLHTLQVKIADRFTSRSQVDGYAATHLASALLAAGRRQDIIKLVSTEREPTAISDPLLRRETQLQRLRIAMKVCREAGSTIDAVLTLLSGAEALRTNTTIHDTLIANPDLTAAFAHMAAPAILRDAQEIQHHGPLLFHMMVEEARRHNTENIRAFTVREGHRQVVAWLQRRNADFEEQKRKHPSWGPNGWEISQSDIAAETEALLRIAGPQEAAERLLRWTPRSVAFRVALQLSIKLITLGDAALLERCLSELRIPKPWDLSLLVPLVLAGRSVEVTGIETSLGVIRRRGLLRLEKLKESWRDDDSYIEYLELVLTACEIVVARSTERENAIALLQSIGDSQWRRYDQLSISNVSRIDFSLRAYGLLSRLEGQETTLQNFLVDPPPPAEEMTLEKQYQAPTNQKKDELHNFLRPLVKAYDVRAQILSGLISGGESEAHLQQAIGRSNVDSYRFESSHYSFAMRTQLAVSITRLLMVPTLDRSVILESARAVLTWKPDDLSGAEVEIYTHLALDHTFHEEILRAITERSNAIKAMKIATQDKIDALIRFARLLRLISVADAEPFFNDIIDVASDVNLETVREIALFAPLVRHGVDAMSHDQRRSIASKLAIIISDASVRLGNSREFPWSAATEALTTLDLPLALAAAGRWGDSNIVKHEELLPTILSVALAKGSLSPDQAAAFSALLDSFQSELINEIIEKAIQKEPPANLKVLIEDLAREELLRFGHGCRPEVSKSLTSLSSPAGFWLGQLTKAEAFHQRERAIEPKDTPQGSVDPVAEHPKAIPPDPLEGIDWNAQRFTSKEDINNVIDQVLEAARQTKVHLAPSTILERIATAVVLRDRRAYLEALSEGGFRGVDNHDVARALVRRLDEWGGAPAITAWCRTQLIQVIVRMLPNLTYYITYGESPLPALLDKTERPSNEIVVVLLAAMEHHVDVLDASTTFALVGLLGEHCTPVEAAEIAERYALRLVERIPAQDQDRWELVDIPASGSAAAARFLYALMSDVDARIRWRAAHALRRLARYGNNETLDHIVTLYEHTGEPSYRNPDIPFYWLASRLWLVIAMDRIASETPEVAARYGDWLFHVAVDATFPHVLIRAFAKSALSYLMEAGVLVLDEEKRSTLDSVNMGSLPKQQRNRSRRDRFDRYSYQQAKERRFHFDPMDTLPYWYSPALQLFFDVSTEEFLDVAEHWIVDCWGVRDNPQEWAKEPRQYRDERGLSSMSVGHDHGSLPRLERYHTYLEWHAMWCTVGQLIQTRPLLQEEEDDGNYYSFDGWLRRNGLSMPPFWLSDFRGAKPLEDQFWFPPEGDINAWVDRVSDQDFLAQSMTSDNLEMLVVDGYYDTRSSNFKQEVRVRTALVSPDTALALVRALQTVPDWSYYKIPYVDDELQIDAPPYRLLGWLSDVAHLEEGIDEHDPLRYEVRAIETRPGQQIETTLSLNFLYNSQLQWANNQNRSFAFVYEAWGDSRGDEPHHTLQYNKQVRSSGYRLQIDRCALYAFLNEVNLDLIVEVNITRENSGYGRERYDEEKAKEARYDRVFAFRRDGTIDAAEGRLGTWTVSRS